MVGFVATPIGRENLRIRVLESLNSDLTAFTDAKKISKQDVIDGVLKWFLEQDPMLQLMILGVVPEKRRGQVAEILLEEMAGKRAPRADAKDGTPVRKSKGSITHGGVTRPIP